MLHIIYKASINSITTDEAYTYLEYVYTNNIFNIGVANNHVLNTFLMSITTFFGNSEIFLRLPNVLSGIAYLITIGYLVQDSSYKIYTTLILTSPIYLIEYFTLARGYGLSSFLIFFGCVNYYCIKPYKYNFLISCLCFIISALSIHIYIIFSIFFIVLNLRFEIKKNLKIFIVAVLIKIFFSFYIVAWIFLIARPGHLYGAGSISILELFKSIFGFLDLFQLKNSLFLIPVYLLFLLPFTLFFSSNSKAKNLYLISVLTLVSFFILPIIFDQPFPIRRVLIPLLPPFLLTNVIIVENLKKFRYKSLLANTLSFLVFINLFLNLNVNSTIDWGKKVNQDTLTCLEVDDYLDGILIRPVEYYKLINKEKLNIICN